MRPPTAEPNRRIRFASAVSLAVGLAGFATSSPSPAAVKRLSVQFEDMVCSYLPFRTHRVEELLLDGCPFPGLPAGRLRYDWYGAMVRVPDGARWLSADGRHAVTSAGSMGGGSAVLLHDLVDGSATLVTTTASGVASTGSNFGARLSADGESVLFTSSAQDLLPPDSGGVAVLEWRRAGGPPALRAASAHLMGASADGDVIVVFNTWLSEPYFALLDRNAGTRETYCVARASVCEFLGLSPDGRWLVYAHAASGEPSSRVLRDRLTGVDTALPGFAREAGHVAFDHASQRMLYDRPEAEARGGHGFVLRQLIDGSERNVFFDRRVYWSDAPVAFGPGSLVALWDGATAISSLDTVFTADFD